MLIRVLLLSMLAFIGFRFFLRRQKLPMHIVILFLILGTGGVFVIFPQIPDELAHLVGIGRGADLITYLVEISVLFVLLHYYTKFVELESHLTQITRELAILSARRPTEPPPAAPPR